MIRPQELTIDGAGPGGTLTGGVGHGPPPTTLSLFPTRTPTIPPATHTNSYALGGRSVLLVEPATPYEDEQRAWIEWAREIGSSGKNILAIVATHHHPDHIGGARLLALQLGLPVWAHELTASRIDVPVSRRLQNGDEIVLAGPRDECWRVLHTPGHAPGHICLFETRSRVMVVGDMVASEGTILIAPGDGDMTLYLEQLERLAALGVSVALPAHGAPIEAPTTTFERYVTHRRMREEKILNALARTTCATSLELVPVAYDDVSPNAWPFARLSIDAHLEKLERDGRVVRDPERDKAFRAVR